MSRKSNVFTETLAAIRKRMPGLVLVSSFVNILLLTTSIYMLQIYDKVLSSGSLDTLVWLTVIAMFAVVVYGVLEQSRRLILTRAAGFIDRELNAPVLRQSMENRLAGQSGQAGIRDVSDLRNFYEGDAVLAFLDAPWSPVFIAFVWLLHPVLGMIVAGGALVLFCATIANDLLTRKRQKEAARAVREANDAAIRFVEGGETISPLGMAPALFRRWKDWQDRARSEQGELGEKTTTILNFTRSFRQAVQMTILGSGAYFVLVGQITPGVMIAASIIGMRALAPIERLTAAWRKFVAARQANVALAAVFSGLASMPEAVKLPRPEGKLAVEDVTLLEQQTKKPILNGVGFALEPGEICAVIGPSGAGKSSLCRLIVGARKPDAGAVRLDGADTYVWKSDDLGPYLGYLPQKVELFPGTVAENISRFAEAEGDATLDAARCAGADQLILRLSNGFETDVGPNAERLSLGQQQRIGLARALYGNPALVVLDEPNSNLDTEGDNALIEALARLKALGTTVVIVSHRTEILKAVDKILFLRDGSVVKFCDRDDVLKPKSQPGAGIRLQPVAASAKKPARKTIKTSGVPSPKPAE